MSSASASPRGPAPPMRRDDHRRNVHQQNGARFAQGLRPDAGAALRHLHASIRFIVVASTRIWAARSRQCSLSRPILFGFSLHQATKAARFKKLNLTYPPLLFHWTLPSRLSPRPKLTRSLHDEVWLNQIPTKYLEHLCAAEGHQALGVGMLPSQFENKSPRAADAIKQTTNKHSLTVLELMELASQCIVCRNALTPTIPEGANPRGRPGRRSHAR
jgi:hypothetical protein